MYIKLVVYNNRATELWLY